VNFGNVGCESLPPANCRPQRMILACSKRYWVRGGLQKRKSAIFTHYESAKKLLRKRNSDRCRDPQHRFTKPQTGQELIVLQLYNCINFDFILCNSDFDFNFILYYNLLLCFILLEMHVRFICAIEFYLLTYLLKNSAISKWLVLFFRTVVVAFGWSRYGIC